MSARTVQLTVELTPEQAAGLCRLTDKMARSEAMAVLYPHLPVSLREDQVRDILAACFHVQKALGKAGVGAWPWIDTGRV